MTNIINLGDHKESLTYTLTITQNYLGEVTYEFDDEVDTEGESARNIATHLRVIAASLEQDNETN